MIGQSHSTSEWHRPRSVWFQSPGCRSKGYRIAFPKPQSLHTIHHIHHFPGGTNDKESACQCRRLRFNPWVGKILWRRKWQPTTVFLPGKFHGQRSLAGYIQFTGPQSQTWLSDWTHTHIMLGTECLCLPLTLPRSYADTLTLSVMVSRGGVFER